MPRKLVYSTLLLTGVNLLLRLVGTTFQVYLSGQIGAAGVGLLQLVLSVGSLALVAGMGGIRTTTMYLCAEELGNGKNISRVLSACFLYSFLFSGTVAAGLWALSPRIAGSWIGALEIVPTLRLFAAFLPVVCLCGVMTGYFTAANRIGTLAAVEVAEQVFTLTVTMVLLQFWRSPPLACLAVILGSSAGACLTLSCLLVLRKRERDRIGPKIPMTRRLLQAALPLALADDLKSGITTVENLMVPRRLACNPRISSPLAAFGMVSGMVFPVMMFPAAILFGLNELLIPELARCAAAGRRNRILYLVKKSLRVTMIYGIVCCGILVLGADGLCLRLFGSTEAAHQLRLFSLLVPMLYCDAVTDAMTKGLGQQKICVIYNIVTSFLDVLFLYLLLPKYGMSGYFCSFWVTHLLNFLLSLGRLLRITGLHIPFSLPALAGASMLFSIFAASFVEPPLIRCGAYLVLLGCTLFLFQVLDRADLRWLRGLVQKNSLTVW